MVDPFVKVGVGIMGKCPHVQDYNLNAIQETVCEHENISKHHSM